MTKKELDFIGSMNMCDEISNEAYKKIVNHVEETEISDDCVSREQAIKTIGTDIQLNLEGRSGLLKYSDEIKDILKTLLDSQEKKLKALPPVTPTFPKGTTNGDMIKAMFPKIEIYTDVINEIVDVEICKDSSELRCSIDWWNAPYKGSEG